MINKLKSRAYDFLRWSQKYTGTDNVYLAKGGFWLTLGQILSSAASFLSTIAFANLVDPITYGNYKYIISIIGTIGIFSLNGMGIAISQAVARGFENSFYSGFKTKLKWSCLGSFAAIMGAIYYWAKGNEILPLPLVMIAVFLPLMQSSSIYSSFLTGRKIFNIQVKYTTINNVFATAVMITAIFVTKNLFWLIAIYLISHTSLNLLFYLITKKRFRPNKREDIETIPYGKHLSLMGIIANFALYIDKILLFTFIGSTQVAVYSFAIAVPEQIKSVLKNINTLALPKFSTKSQEKIKENVGKKIRKLFLFTGLVFLAYLVFAPYLYKIFFPQYLESITYSLWYSLTIITVPVYFFTTIFSAKMKKAELYKIQIAPPIVKILLLIVLTPIYGIWGVVVGQMVASVFTLALAIFLFKRS
jgi:O-antigen/teichoic acid export membrane protein